MLNRQHTACGKQSRLSRALKYLRVIISAKQHVPQLQLTAGFLMTVLFDCVAGAFRKGLLNAFLGRLV